MIRVFTPAGCETTELEYVLSTVFSNFLDLHWQYETTDIDFYCIRLDDQHGEIRLPNVFLMQSKGASLPSQTLIRWNCRELASDIPLVNPVLPIIYGDAQPAIRLEEQCINLPIDIFGSAFFMLSRYEEAVLSDRDRHDRFPATASIAYKAGFLDRPIIDEYVEILWAAMKRVWPNLERKTRQGRVQVSCDVDQPFDCRVRHLRRLVRRMGGDLLVRRDIKLALTRIRDHLASRRGDFRHDPYYTFDWYLDACEKAGRRAGFYFIADHSAGTMDGCYAIDESDIIELIRHIGQRGHELGVHGSYNTYRDATQIDRERRRMIAACRKAGVDDSVSGNRQHYLRWDTRQTPDHLEAAGFAYDTTGSFADRPGFRYGTARSFPMWSWQTNAPLRIRQRPLILMECSVIANRYLGLGYTQEAMDRMLTLKQRALAHGGDFTLLWHNSHLTTAEDRAFFQELIA